MKRINSNVLAVVLLVAISFLTYGLQLIRFNSPRDTFFYLLQDLAFLPLQVAIVTIVLNKFLSMREKNERLKKMNMAISAFFSEAGTDVIEKLIEFSKNTSEIKSTLDVVATWKSENFNKAKSIVKSYDFGIDSRFGDLNELKDVLKLKRYFLLTMLENPNLLEHDTFTDMLWALFHLTDELIARESLIDLPEADLDHLSIDIKRAFSTVLIEWIGYMEHLKSDYPYLFAMAVRKNPFNDNKSIIIR